MRRRAATTEETAVGAFTGVVIACLGIAALCWLVASRCMCGGASDVALAHVQVDALAASIDPATCDPCRLPEELRDPWNVRVEIRCTGGEVHVRSAGEDRTWYTGDDVVSDVHARDLIAGGQRCRAEP